MSCCAVQHVERLDKEYNVAACLAMGQELATAALTKFADADGCVLPAPLCHKCPLCCA